jgi:hypothetical protein
MSRSESKLCRGLESLYQKRIGRRWRVDKRIHAKLDIVSK